MKSVFLLACLFVCMLVTPYMVECKMIITTCNLKMLDLCQVAALLFVHWCKKAFKSGGP